MFSNVRTEGCEPNHWPMRFWNEYIAGTSASSIPSLPLWDFQREVVEIRSSNIPELLFYQVDLRPHFESETLETKHGVLRPALWICPPKAPKWVRKGSLEKEVAAFQPFSLPLVQFQLVLEKVVGKTARVQKESKEGAKHFVTFVRRGSCGERNGTPNSENLQEDNLEETLYPSEFFLPGESAESVNIRKLLAPLEDLHWFVRSWIFFRPFDEVTSNDAKSVCRH